MHTQGPWVSDEMVHNMMEFRVYSSSGKVIARVQDFTTFREDVEQADANARLIAAAPELLEALKSVTARCEAYYGSEYPATKQGWAAIAKAEGKP